jgi:hypothetical protein
LSIPDPDADFLPIPDPGVKKAPDPGSGSATLVKGNKYSILFYSDFQLPAADLTVFCLCDLRAGLRGDKVEVLADAVQRDAAQAQEVALQLLPVLNAGDGGEGQLAQLRILHKHRSL